MSSFGDLLRTLRYKSGFTQADLARALDNYQPVISNYERERSKPSRDEILAIAKILKLDESETNELLTSAEYAPVRTISGKITADRINSINVHQVDSASASYQELNIQIQDIKDSLVSLSERFTQGNSSTPQSEVIAQVQDLQTAISELQATSQEITAPVALPTKQQLEVKLIPTTSFERLEEYRAEENKWFTWFGIFLGAVIGVFVNLITGGKATISTWIVVVTFLVMAGISGLSVRSYSQRAMRLRDDILQKKASPTKTNSEAR